MRRLPVSVLTVALFTLGGCGFIGAADRGVDKPGQFTLQGYASVGGAAAGTPGTPCEAAGLSAGVPVKVTDPAGTALGAGELSPGVLAMGPGGGYRCNFPFSVADVPGGPATYVVAVGGLPPVSFPSLDLRQGEPAVVDAPTASTSPS